MIDATYANRHDRQWLVQELRSDHAGETGAVWIYRGILAVSRQPEVVTFARHHLETEERHLRTIEELIEPGQQSLMLFLWRASGFVLGALPALFGAAAVYRTIEAVETFVEHHYRPQVERLRADDKHELADILDACMADEIAHRLDAATRLPAPGIIGRLWSRVVGAGSAGAVVLARRI